MGKSMANNQKTVINNLVIVWQGSSYSVIAPPDGTVLFRHTLKEVAIDWARGETKYTSNQYKPYDYDKLGFPNESHEKSNDAENTINITEKPKRDKSKNNSSKSGDEIIALTSFFDKFPKPFSDIFRIILVLVGIGIFFLLIEMPFNDLSKANWFGIGLFGICIILIFKALDALFKDSPSRGVLGILVLMMFFGVCNQTGLWVGILSFVKTGSTENIFIVFKDVNWFGIALIGFVLVAIIGIIVSNFGVSLSSGCLTIFVVIMLLMVCNGIGFLGNFLNWVF
jgi:hypothetical protein